MPALPSLVKTEPAEKLRLLLSHKHPERNAVLDDTKTDKVSVYDPSQQSIKREENIKCMMTKVQSSNTLDVLDEVIPLTSLSGQVATPEQKIDLLGFWKVGHERFDNHIKIYF